MEAYDDKIHPKRGPDNQAKLKDIKWLDRFQFIYKNTHSWVPKLRQMPVREWSCF